MSDLVKYPQLRLGHASIKEKMADSTTADSILRTFAVLLLVGLVGGVIYRLWYSLRGAHPLAAFVIAAFLIWVAYNAIVGHQRPMINAVEWVFTVLIAVAGVITVYKWFHEQKDSKIP